jgi:hypothetical protein
MTHSEHLETIHADSGKHDYAYIEMERVFKKLNAVHNPKNKDPFWKRNITHVNSDWRDGCISFSYDEEIIDIHEFIAKHGDIVDKEIEIILVEEFEKAIINDEQEDEIFIKKRKEYNYIWKPLEPWEKELYDYMETCD